MGGTQMAQSLSRILVHVVFSTKNRVPMIRADIAPALFAYMAGILAQIQCPALQVGGTTDHVHILLVLHRTVTVAKAVERVKTGSCVWMKRERGCSVFAWQAGYGAFSIGASQIGTVTEYIKSQTTHHQRVSFQDEFRMFLKRYQIEYDEQYVWD